MTDDQLEHACNLSAIVIDGIEHHSMFDLLCDATGDTAEAKDQHTMLKILARTCVELMRRQGIKPRYRVPVTEYLGGITSNDGKIKKELKMLESAARILYNFCSNANIKTKGLEIKCSRVLFSYIFFILEKEKDNFKPEADIRRYQRPNEFTISGIKFVNTYRDE